MKDVYTLDDLASRAGLDAGSEQPARLAVIGHPIAHSLSPQLHQPALEAAGTGIRYIRLEVEPLQISTAFQQLAALGFIGANITVPHKFEALSACTSVHENATVLGAVNTVLFEGGEVLGFNTDGPGFVRAIREVFSVDIKDLRIMIVGAGGGAGQAIAAQCALEGCEHLVLVNRTLDKATRLAQRLAPHFESERLEGPGDRLVVLAADSPDLQAESDHVDLIINTTSLGMKRTDPSPLPAACLQPHHLVYDTIYNPAQTRLLSEAARHGARTANGLSLLLHQGVLAFELWFPGQDPKEVMRKALEGMVRV
jgi:shikimate dehydrogenase